MLVGDPAGSVLFFGDFMGVEEEILLLVPDRLGDTGCAPWSITFCGEVTALSSGESLFCLVSDLIANGSGSLSEISVPFLTGDFVGVDSCLPFLGPGENNGIKLLPHAIPIKVQ